MECPICLESLNNKFSCKTPCAHNFCLKCFLKLKDLKCPICRQSFTNTLPDKLLPIFEENNFEGGRRKRYTTFLNEDDFPPLT